MYAIKIFFGWEGGEEYNYLSFTFLNGVQNCVDIKLKVINWTEKRIFLQLYGPYL